GPPAPPAPPAPLRLIESVSRRGDASRAWSSAPMAKPRRTRPAPLPTPVVRPVPSSVPSIREPSSGESAAVWIRAGLLVLAGALVYLNGLSGPFTFDDSAAIVS